MAVKRRSFAQARRVAGHTQESLAEHLEVDRTTVARWESGEYSPQPWLRPKIAEAFGLSLSTLSELLLSVYSSMSSSIGIYCFDLDDPASAMHYGESARKAAQDARNTEQAIYALCMMSHFASRHGKTHAGIDFAAAAQNLAGKTDDVLLQVCIAERFASAYGLDGQYKESMAEFDRALAGLALPAGRRSPESPVYWFNEGLIASRQSDCLLRQNEPLKPLLVLKAHYSSLTIRSFATLPSVPST